MFRNIFRGAQNDFLFKGLHVQACGKAGKTQRPATRTGSTAGREKSRHTSAPRPAAAAPANRAVPTLRLSNISPPRLLAKMEPRVVMPQEMDWPLAESRLSI